MSGKAFDDEVDREAQDWEYNTYDEVQEAITSAAGVAVSEQGGDLGEEDAMHDLAIAFFPSMEPSVRFEIAQSFLGWDPEGDADLYERHNIPIRLDYY